MISSVLLGLYALSAVTASPHPVGELEQRQTCTNSATDRSCWGDYSTDTNWYTTIFSTGVTREYWLEITNTTQAPDGVERVVLTVNGTVPGPTLTADWGDTLIVHVTNMLTDNGTSIHFHGLRQLNSIQNDGVVSVTQCATAPGDTYTYTWNATQYGTSWYHSHYSLQAWDGVFGGIVINGPATANYDEDLGNLFIQDWDHQTASSQFDYDKVNGPPVIDTGLINGTNMHDGAGKYFETTFVDGISYRLRLVNSAIDSFFKFSIDNHTMTVIAMDFVPVVPFEIDILSIAIGQRYDVIVTANEPVSGVTDYWMRAIPQVTCSSNDNVDGILGIVRYDSSSTADPTTVAYSYTDSCDDIPMSSLVPYLALDAGAASITEDLEVTVGLDDTTDYIYWYVAGSDLYLNWSNPTLNQVYKNETFVESDNVYEITTEGDWTYLILEQNIAAYHPIHLHGHDFYLLAQGSGTYASAAPTLVTTNPPRRDVAMLPGQGYLVFGFLADNPGTWIVHCHIGWHQNLGLALQFVEDRDSIVELGLFDETVMNDTCTSWDAWLSETDTRQTDDGI